MLGQPGRPTSSRIALSLLVALVTACGFPRPPDIGDDATPAGCSRDQDCTGATPFCVNAACAACRDSTSCPAARPVCDLVSHDCRTCVRDSECDSGACDLAAGTCVAQGQILYVSPGGTKADPCTRANPCSFFQAGAMVDASHPYIVLLPGIEPTAPLFDGKKATVVGGGNSAAPNISLSHGASITIRDLSLNESQSISLPMFGAAEAIFSDGSDLVLDNVTFRLTNLAALLALNGGNITIRNSIIDNGFLNVSAQVVIDRATFLRSAGISSFSTDKPIEISNSLFVSASGNPTIIINSTTDTTALGTAYIASNTFINATIECGGSSLYGKVFDSNIFYNAGSLASPAGCDYSYNLITPSVNVGGGTGNITGDPLFVDAANNDFHLKAGSPAVDAANPSPAPNGHDHDGKPRPQSGRADIGAFEYTP